VILLLNGWRNTLNGIDKFIQGRRWCSYLKDIAGRVKKLLNKAEGGRIIC
jgi:hypothetical protein